MNADLYVNSPSRCTMELRELMNHPSLEPLPFRDGQFDFVRMSHVALAVPEDEWQYLFEVESIYGSYTSIC